MSESKRDLSELLWCDLASDEERLDFLRLGMAVKTGIVAPAIADEAYRAFHFLYTNGPGYAPDSTNYFTPSVALVRHKPTGKVYIYIVRGPMSGYKHYWVQEYDQTKCMWLSEDECERYYGYDQQKEMKDDAATCSNRLSGVCGPVDCSFGTHCHQGGDEPTI